MLSPPSPSPNAVQLEIIIHANVLKSQWFVKIYTLKDELTG